MNKKIILLSMMTVVFSTNVFAQKIQSIPPEVFNKYKEEHKLNSPHIILKKEDFEKMNVPFPDLSKEKKYTKIPATPEIPHRPVPPPQDNIEFKKMIGKKVDLPPDPNAPNQKTGNKAIDDYNEKRKSFLVKKEQAKQAMLIQKKKLEAEQAILFNRQALKDEGRRRLGIPISRFENPEGGVPMTRENMMMMEQAAGRSMPPQPPIGNVVKIQPPR